MIETYTWPFYSKRVIENEHDYIQNIKRSWKTNYYNLNLYWRAVVPGAIVRLRIKCYTILILLELLSETNIIQHEHHTIYK